MAIKATNLSDGTIEVIVHMDSAIDCTDEQYAEYQKTLDESLLNIKENDEPTRFVMRKVLPYGLAQKVQNKQFRLEKGDMQIQVAFMAEEVRCALVGIKNPESIPESEKIKWEKGSDGGASEELMAKLMAAGIVNDLFVARNSFLQKGSHKADPKKS